MFDKQNEGHSRSGRPLRLCDELYSSWRMLTDIPVAAGLQ